MFVHHFGNRTFAALKVDCPRQFEENLGRFREKWGRRTEAAGYHLPEPAVPPRGTAIAAGAAPVPENGRDGRAPACRFA